MIVALIQTISKGQFHIHRTWETTPTLTHVMAMDGDIYINDTKW